LGNYSLIHYAYMSFLVGFTKVHFLREISNHWFNTRRNYNQQRSDGYTQNIEK